MSGLDINDRDRDDTAHVEWDEFAVGWALRALEPHDEDRFSVHLKACPRCQTTVADSGAIITEVLNQLPLQSPSPQLRDRLLAEAAKTRPNPASQSERQARPEPESGRTEAAQSDGALIDLAAARHRPAAGRTRSSWTTMRTLLVAAAAVLVIAGLGIWNLTLQTDRDRAAAIAADRGEILQDLAAAGDVQMTPLVDGDGDTLAFLVMGTGTAMVMTNGLDVNTESETTYVLWGLQEVGQQPVPLGTFDVVHNELDMRTVGSTVSGIDTFNGYGLTLESGRSAPTSPTLPMVASGQVTN